MYPVSKIILSWKLFKCKQLMRTIRNLIWHVQQCQEKYNPRKPTSSSDYSKFCSVRTVKWCLAYENKNLLRSQIQQYCQNIKLFKAAIEMKPCRNTLIRCWTALTTICFPFDCAFGTRQIHLLQRIEETIFLALSWEGSTSRTAKAEKHSHQHWNKHY